MHAAVVFKRSNLAQALRCLSVVIGVRGRRLAGRERLDSSFRLLASNNGQTGNPIGIASNGHTDHGHGEHTCPDPASLPHVARLHSLGFVRVLPLSHARSIFSALDKGNGYMQAVGIRRLADGETSPRHRAQPRRRRRSSACQNERLAGSMLRPGQFQEVLWAAQKRAGLRCIKWHDLRHSYASILASGGMPLLMTERHAIERRSTEIDSGKAVLRELTKSQQPNDRYPVFVGIGTGAARVGMRG
jgi:hypothetical protein